VYLLSTAGATKFYSVLKKDATYRRRVSWLGIGARENIALVEYFGKFPGLSQHGLDKK
jgi:hypothetical protein